MRRKNLQFSPREFSNLKIILLNLQYIISAGYDTVKIYSEYGLILPWSIQYPATLCRVQESTQHYLFFPLHVDQGTYVWLPPSFEPIQSDVLSSSTVNSKCDHTFKVTLAYIAGKIGLLRSRFVLFAIPVREAFALFVEEIDGNLKKICS